VSSPSLKRFSQDERGAAMVEFAIVAVVFFIPLIFGIVEFGRMAWAKSTVTAAAREGARFAIVHGSASPSTADSAAVAAYVENRTLLSPIIVSTTWVPSKDPGDTVKVTVKYSYSSLIPVVPPKLLTATSRQIISY
jgi:Flp pilus assembly protein TadG